MWMTIHGVSAHRAVFDMAKLLNLTDESTHRWLLLETGEMSDDPDEALMIASTRADLVLSELPRCVLWFGIPIDIDWDKHPALWAYLLTLATAAKRGEGVDASDFGESRKRDYHVKLKSRLTNMDHFPVDLADLIIAHQNGRQNLDLPRERICILETVTKATVRELV